jgi:hypothetical protein
MKKLIAAAAFIAAQWQPACAQTILGSIPEEFRGDWCWQENSHRAAGPTVIQGSVRASATATRRADHAQYAKLPELLQRRSVILNASVSGISCTPEVGSALLAHSGSGLADTANHHPARATAHTRLRDRTVWLMQRRERNCLCSAS